MITELFLVALQSLCVVILGLVGILKVTRTPEGSPNRLGKVLLWASGFAYVFSVSCLHITSAQRQKTFARQQKTFAQRQEISVQQEGLLIRHIKVLSEELLGQVMENAPSEEVPKDPGMKSKPDSLLITEPVNSSVVRKQRVDVIGKVSDPKLNVWVIVHPVGLSAYWIQPPVAVRKDGSWQVPVYIGRAGDIDVGREFDIMAVADPEPKLNEGRILSEWPKAKWRSDIVTVVRK